MLFFQQKKESECLQLKILVLRNELERQKKALGQEVALLHKEKSTLHDRGKCKTAAIADIHNPLVRRVVALLMVMVTNMKVLV